MCVSSLVRNSVEFYFSAVSIDPSPFLRLARFSTDQKKRWSRITETQDQSACHAAANTNLIFQRKKAFERIPSSEVIPKFVSDFVRMEVGRLPRFRL